MKLRKKESPRLFATPSAEELTSSPAVSPASLTRLQEAVKGLVMSVTSGRSSGESLAKLNQDGLWLKTYQGCSLQKVLFPVSPEISFETYSGICPRWGTLLAGVLSGLSMWERGTDETGCSLWRTPNTMDGMEAKSQEALEHEMEHRPGRSEPNNLRDQIAVREGLRMWPTPSTEDYKDDGEAVMNRIGTPEMKTCDRRLRNFVKVLPTPQSRDFRTGAGHRWMNPEEHSRDLNDAIAYENGYKLYPTPEASEVRQGYQDRTNGKKGTQESLSTVIINEEGGRDSVSGQLNPTWVEWLMGFPIGWTDLEHSETP